MQEAPVRFLSREDLEKGSWVSLVAQLVKDLSAVQETWIGKIPWRRERLITPVFWPGEFHGLFSPWGHKESEVTGRLSLSLMVQPVKNPAALQETQERSD